MIKLPKSIKWIITDFDGILTDNCVYINDDLSTSKKINYKDLMGVAILRRNDYNIAIISGDKSGAIDAIAQRFKLQEVYQDIRVKIDILKSIVEKYALSEEEFVYIGDDINDIQCLEYAKYKVTVPHAVKNVKQVLEIQITENDGGNGAFREVADCLVG
ncbi:MAG: HAD family hydrolase [Cyanobacteria bacterium SIG32]|nr:HAD family hydrolase [Cyanobacteria bacterium SIG32]